ncbi:MAG: AAA family ATPase [Bacteroidales bacterium]|jgi:predicted ATP-dependent endonuclease of OLD family|nr:AAA family ATPase [Bacteroidales bacterium]
MKLQKLTIKNFRGLKGENNTIDFSKSDILFLIGQNNVGKSTYLHAYQFFVNSKQNAEEEDFNNYDKRNPIIIEGIFLKEDKDEQESDFIGLGKNKDPDWINKWVDDEGLIKIRKTWNKIGLFEKETYSPIEHEWVPNGFGGMESLFTKYSPQPIIINAMEDEKSLDEKVNKLIQDKYLKKIKEQQKDLYKEASEKIQELQKKVIDSDEVSNLNLELNKHFKEIFPQLELQIQANKDENIKVEDSFKKNYTVTVHQNDIDRKETFLQNGHGIIRQALYNFIAFLQENTDSNRKEYIILFEEPELFLHPKITFKLRESLYKLSNNSPYQILCATHSPMMIDISKEHSSLIRVVKDDNENIYTYQVDDNIFAKNEEQKERVQMINRFNPHICEAFYADKVILVEGDTETIVYRELLKKFYPNEEIFVLNTGSKNNMPFFLEILTAFKIEHYVIHDMDTEYTSNGRKNPSWSLNKTIWELVEEANKQKQGLSKRYVHNANFENAHKYKLVHGKDKPLQAFRFAKSIINRQGEIPDCLKWLDDIMGSKEIIHDMNYIESNKKTIEQIEEEKKSYKILQ